GGRVRHAPRLGGGAAIRGAAWVVWRGVVSAVRGGSAAEVRRGSKRSLTAAPLTLAVAVMQPMPPARSVASRKTSEPGKTSKPGNRLRIASVLFQSPELSLRPITTDGYSLIKRSIKLRL